MIDRTTCPECKGRMSEGFIPDATYGAILQTHWYEGEPESTSFLGISTGLSVDQKKMMPVRTWRCQSCGLLRSYADRGR